METDCVNTDTPRSNYKHLMNNTYNNSSSKAKTTKIDKSSFFNLQNKQIFFLQNRQLTNTIQQTTIKCKYRNNLNILNTFMYLKSIRRLWGTNRQIHNANGPGEEVPESRVVKPIRLEPFISAT